MPGNLVTSLDTFIGRKRELGALARLIEKHRLVTLIGPAGSGKTRLALELASRIRGAYRDGAWSMDFTMISNGDLVVPTIGGTLGIRSHSAVLELGALATALAGKELLLLFDNCEHVLASCASTVETLLCHCPSVHMVATSREALRSLGERVFPVVELPLPEPGITLSKHEIRRSDAVRLFVDRANAVDPGFQLSEHNAVAVAALCQRLDGMPLAIELAARRVRLGLDEILTRLNGRLNLLSLGYRTGTSRHSSLQAAIDWSYELLDVEEQAAWRRLSVLTGSFSLELAAAVCGGSPDDLLHVLAGLEAKSLLVSRTMDDESIRFRQLESIRIYGKDRLAAAGELESTHEHLVAWLVDLVESHVDEFALPPALLGELDSQWSNLLMAVEWTATTSDERHATLVYALACTWLEFRNHVAESQWLLRLALDGVSHRPHHAGLLLGELARAAMLRGEYAEALRFAERAVEIERRLDRPARLARALDELAYALSCLGNMTEARTRYLESLDILRSLDKPVALMALLNNVAWVALSWGEDDLAAALVNEGLPITREHDSLGSFTTAMLHTAGVLALNRGELDLAQASFTEALEVAPLNPYNVVHTTEGLAIVAVRCGEAEWGLRLIECAAAIRSDENIAHDLLWRKRVDAAVAAATERLSPRQVRAAAAAGRRVSLRQAAGYARDRVGSVIGRGDGDIQDTEGLSERELMVAALVAEGLTNQQIAHRLQVSPTTVATHLDRARDKLGLRSRTQLAAWFVREKNVR